MKVQSEITQLHIKLAADLGDQVREFRMNRRWSLQVAVEELLKAGLKAFAEKKD